MVDIHTVLAKHLSKVKSTDKVDSIKSDGSSSPPHSYIPDLFFDEVLSKFKLGRSDIQVLMTLYRYVWSYPNLYRKYGISPMLSHNDLLKLISIDQNEFHNSLKKLEEYGFIETIRSGQYFVRRYFTKEYDELYGQTYNDF